MSPTAIFSAPFLQWGWNDGFQKQFQDCLRTSVVQGSAYWRMVPLLWIDGGPDQTLGALQEFLRWWDYWLKDIDTGIMNEPMLRAYMEESTQPLP
ncbi:MAG: hypothetical protein CM1200mP39_27910 [Dehalococcoidia bacterium]|nr:MAG: hypothetical protein CM1200mP39_27910 [Dehalococcoidia bacterium]